MSLETVQKLMYKNNQLIEKIKRDNELLSVVEKTIVDFNDSVINIISHTTTIKICGFCSGTNNNQENRKLKKCGGCKKTYYCSVDCQSQDWIFHKKICSV
jgi:nucleoid DNA-binding protein